MRDILSRLRAALTPQAAMLLAVLALLMMMGGRQNDSLEKRVSRTLSSVDGAGQVSVTIAVREIEGSSGIMDTRRTHRVPCGAVAVAQGADDPLVALALQEALCALLGLPSSSVSVMKGGR